MTRVARKAETNHAALKETVMSELHVLLVTHVVDEVVPAQETAPGLHAEELIQAHAVKQAAVAADLDT